MVQQKGRARFEAGAVTFIVQHELWDGNVQDHSDQGVAVLVAKPDDETTLLRFNCFDIFAVQLLRHRKELYLRPGKREQDVPDGPYH